VQRQEPQRVRPPRHLLVPTVEDWVSPQEEPPNCGFNPMNRGDGDGLAWRFRQLASQRWHAEVAKWRREHPDVDLPVREYRTWKLLASPGAVACGWRDQCAFLAQVRP
jgi:hypothetical protein